MTTDQAMDSEVREFHQALTNLVRAYQFRDRDAICCYDVPFVQSHGLEVLLREGALTMTAFAEALFLEKSSATRLVDALERKGYVVRRRDTSDGRFFQLDLTKRGRQLAHKVEEDLVAERQRLLSGFAPEERKVVIRSVRTLAEAASRQARAVSSTTPLKASGQ